MTRGLAAFLVPVLAMTALLYQGLASVDVSAGETATVLVIAAGLTLAAIFGVVAALGDDRVRVLVFSLTTVLLLDLTVHPTRLLDALGHRLAARRDARRVGDLHRIKEALETYIKAVGPLPEPVRYGEGAGPDTFWPGWWDLSSADGDRDGHPFLDFLEERGIRVPLDPLNRSPSSVDPRLGSQYVYLLIPAGYGYEGGTCDAWSKSWVYVLAITDLETESVKPPQQAKGSGCSCLWRTAPDFFQQHFDYVLCDSFQR